MLLDRVTRKVSRSRWSRGMKTLGTRMKEARLDRASDNTWLNRVAGQSRSQSLHYPCPAERGLRLPILLDKGIEDSTNEIGRGCSTSADCYCVENRASNGTLDFLILAK